MFIPMPLPIQLYKLPIAPICYTNDVFYKCLGHGHGYECHNSKRSSGFALGLCSSTSSHVSKGLEGSRMDLDILRLGNVLRESLSTGYGLLDSTEIYESKQEQMFPTNTYRNIVLLVQTSPNISGILRESTGECNLGVPYSSSLLCICRM